MILLGSSSAKCPALSTQFDSPPAKMKKLSGQEGSVELRSSVGAQSSFK
jgi:hypothetical protein